MRGSPVAEPRPKEKSISNLAAELWDLVLAYAKQETIEPAKGLGRFVARGVIGSVLLGIGTILLVLAVLRLLQDETGTVFDGNLSMVPYVLTLLLCAGVVVAALSAVRKKGS
jgi:uncharacterized membrane protein YidH (DUF202 family)